MATDDLMAVAGRLGAATDSLAALAAWIRLETEQLDADPAIRDTLRAMAAELLGDAVTPDPARSGAVLGLARTFFRQGAELIENPGRAGAWDQADVPLLQSIGRLSMGIVDAVRAAGELRPGLAALLAGHSRFVDVGVGTGWLAIALARAYPQLRVIGIDIFEPALSLAKGNVVAEGLSGRIELRRENALDLEPDSAEVIWVPLPFLPEEIVPDALAAAARALVPGGWLLAGTFAPGGPGRLAELSMELRTLRSGGRPWRIGELVTMLTAAGLDEATEVPRSWASPVYLSIGRRP